MSTQGSLERYIADVLNNLRWNYKIKLTSQALARQRQRMVEAHANNRPVWETVNIILDEEKPPEPYTEPAKYGL